MNEKLKPCPFCGGEAEIYGGEKSAMTGYLSFCKKCSASGPINKKDHITFDTEEEAAEAWNRRDERHERPD